MRRQESLSDLGNFRLVPSSSVNYIETSLGQLIPLKFFHFVFSLMCIATESLSYRFDKLLTYYREFLKDIYIYIYIYIYIP